MKLSKIIKSKFKDQRGAVAVIVAVSMAMLIGFLALAIDVGYLYATKNELQNVADAAALAGAGKLGEIYSNITDPASYSCDGGDQNDIRLAAQGVVGTGKNSAGGKDIEIRDVDIFIDNLAGVKSAFPTYRFNTNDYNQPDAVRVIARRDATWNGQISMFFARIFNIDFLPVTADATAALSGLAQRAEGGLPIPIGVSKEFFEDGIYCNEPLIFHPTTESCAGWHSFDFGPGDEFKQIKKLLEGLRDDELVSPEAEVFDIFNFNGGTNDAGYKVLDQLFQLRKDDDDDGDPNTWTTSIVVYDGPCYTNPNEPLTILGFAEIKIYGICNSQTAGETYNGVLCEANAEQVVGDIVCDFFEPNRGGGGEYGVMGAIPGLVE